MPASGIEALELQVLGLLVTAVLVATLARRVRIPYTVAMVLTGLVVSALNLAPAYGDIDLSPTLILLIFLPGLLFEAAYHLDLRALRENIGPILLLAVPGVLISMFIIGYLLHMLFALPLAEALLFGVLISATDPIAVIALFKELGVDKRLRIIVEGESLFNDGTAIVLYSILAGIATGREDFLLSASLADFFITVIGGAGLGLAAGLIVSEVMKRTDDHLLDIALTTILAYGTFLVAEVVLEEVFSPVIAVVAAGLYVGNYASKGEYSAPSQVTIVTFWEFVGFLINSAVFLLIGLEVDTSVVVENFPLLLAVIGIVLLARVVVSYGLTFVASRLLTNLPLKWSHILFWGGLRGAVSIALALSLPLTLESRGLLQFLAFGYVVFSIIVQGLTMTPLMKWLNLIGVGERRRDFERERARMAMSEASIEAIEEMRQQHLLSGPISYELEDILQKRVESHWHAMERMIAAQPALVENDIALLQREMVAFQKRALRGLLRRGAISDEIYDEMMEEIDGYRSQMVKEDWHPRSILLHGPDAYLPDWAQEPEEGERLYQRGHKREDVPPIMSSMHVPTEPEAPEG